MPAIQCVVELHWLEIDLFWWQSHSVVRFSRGDMCFVLTRDDSQEPLLATIDWVDSVDDWTIDGTSVLVRVRGAYSASELTLLVSHAGLLTTTS